MNGEDRPIYATDGALRGVTVPKGTSRVQFRYQPRGFPIGIALAVGGLVVFLVVAVVSLQPQRTAERATCTSLHGCVPRRAVG